MSGGHFDYAYFKIDEMARDLQHEIDNNNIPDEWGYSTNASEECLSLIQRSQKIIETAGKLAHEIEYFYSGDHGEETLMELLSEILENTETYQK